MHENRTTRNLIGLSAVTSAMAGIIHFWLTPIHWYHSHAHAIFFTIVGVAQVLWANAVWRNPSTRLYYIGAIMSGGLIVLYAITRWLPSPFGHGPEGVDALGLACKVCELVAMLPPIILIFQGLLLSSGRMAAWETVALILVISVTSGLSTYTLGRAAEIYLPGLVAPDHHEVEEGPPAEHHHETDTPPHDD